MVSQRFRRRNSFFPGAVIKAITLWRIRSIKGIKVAIKNRPETEAVIPDAELKKSVGKSADAFVEKFLGDKATVGNKAAGLGQRFRKILAKR